MTSSSRLEYIHRVAHYKLNFQPKRASDAFRNGLEKVIPHEWLRMFSEVELQVRQPLRHWLQADIPKMICRFSVVVQALTAARLDA